MRFHVVINLVLLLLLGCQNKPAAKLEAPAPKPEPQTLLIHLPGIGGELSIDHSLVRGLSNAKVAQKYRIFDWTGSNRGLVALGTINDNIDQAIILADQVTEFRKQNPEGRILITSHSGGTGVAIWMLEKLPADVYIDELIMLASALSPTYDMSKAFTHVKGPVYSFFSKYDSDVLGTGTTVFGTIDRQQTQGAGYVGFKTDQVSDPVQYAKLQQIPYDNNWLRLGHDGGHIGMMNARFAEMVIAPLFKPGLLAVEVKK